MEVSLESGRKSPDPLLSALAQAIDEETRRSAGAMRSRF